MVFESYKAGYCAQQSGDENRIENFYNVHFFFLIHNNADRSDCKLTWIF